MTVRRLLAATAVATLCWAASASAAADPIPALPARSTLVSQKATFLKLAEQGLQQTRKQFWNSKANWYTTGSNGEPPLATAWYVFPFLELASAVAMADPSPANAAFVNATFKQAEAYWDPTLGPNGGVSWGYGLRNTADGYFDDAGWWGVAYLDAYRATGQRRWLWDASRALSWIDRLGWDRKNGGTWWDTEHRHKTSEPLAAGALIAATLYQQTHETSYLNIAKRYIGWADAHTRNAKQGNLYGRSATDGTVMDYVEGMMISADVQLCQATKKQSWCKKAEAVAAASLKQFPIMANWAPETDVIYERGLLDLYNQDGNPRWYAVAYANGASAATHSLDTNGLWELNWEGGWMTPGTIYGQSATLELFAWLAIAKPPAG